VRALAQDHSAEAVNILVEIMTNPKAPLASRAAAANNILERAIGRSEFSAKVETISQTKEANFDALSEAERDVFLQLAAEISPSSRDYSGPTPMIQTRPR
jgi:hypothetical protein